MIKNRITKYITHNWKFHTDELTWFAISNLVYNDIKLIRTRDQNIINMWLMDKNSIVADIWKEYNIEYLDFDHHFSSTLLESFNNKTAESKYSAKLLGKEDSKEQLKLIHKDVLTYLLNCDTYSLSLLIVAFKDVKFNSKIDLIERIDLTQYITKISREYIQNITDIQSIEDFFIYKYDKYIDYIISNINKKVNDKYIEEINEDFNIEHRYWLDENKVNIKLDFMERIKYRKYSSAWLLWNYFWKDIIKKYINIEISDDEVNFIFNRIDNSFIKYIDLEDNGLLRKLNEKFYISSLINQYNKNDPYDINQDNNFIIASNIVKNHILNLIETYQQQIIDKQLFYSEFIEGNNYQIFSKYIVWIDTLLYENSIDYVEYIIYPWENDTWYIKTMQKWNQFWDWIKLPNEWLISAPDNMIFCHTWLFIAQFKTLNDVLNSLKWV